jgi:signal transduction histidine kinase
MRKIGTLWTFVIISGTDSLLVKVSFYLILNVAVFGFHFFSGQIAGSELMVGFPLGLTFYLFESFLFRLMCIGATTLVYLSIDFGFRSGMFGSPEASATRMNSARWDIFALMLLILAAFAYYMVNKNGQLLRSLKEYSRKVETDLEKEVISGQNKTKFIRNAYHEIRGQFWGVFIIIKILAKAQRTGQMQHMNKIVNDLTNGCQNLQLLLNNILEYSKFESGISELPLLEPINPRLKIGGLIDLYQYAASEKNIQITYWSADDLPDYVACDGMKLTQVVTNLVHNAIKFSKPGTIIEVMLHKDANRWHISVKDHGIGIGPDRLPYIFDPFVTGKYRDNNSDGVGLGLHITKQLVAALQGEIVVSSEENAGSCFTVCLPGLPFDTLREALNFPDPPGNYS